MKISYVGQIFGTRKIIRDYCEPHDWENVKKIPKNKDNYRLGQCMVCGAVMPVSIKLLKRFPPKRCSVCSGIGNRNKTNLRNIWTLYDDHATMNIPFKQKIVTVYIDLIDYDLCKDRIWRISQKRNKFYVISGSKSKRTMIYLHQLILGKPENGYEIDHIDGNSLNNTRKNLRFITRGDNSRFVSVRIDSTIGIRGISFDKRGKFYCVDFTYDHIRFYNKPFKTLEEAVWCRYCFEKYFKLDILIKNPLFQQYNNLIDEKKDEISSYVNTLILNKIREI
mgnify:FL=1